MGDIDPNAIKTKRSNSVPLPRGYRTDLPDQAPENHEAYVDFHNQVGRVMADRNLSQVEKLVMIAYLIHGTDASDDKMMQVCGISRHGLYACQIELMRCDWLASPAG